MPKNVIAWLIVAICLILLVCAVVMLIKLSTAKYETNTYTVTESFRDILLKTDTAKITFVPSENGDCTVTCYEQQKAKHSVTAENNTLMIQLQDTRKWYEYISINFSSPKITISLPAVEYGALTIHSSTGDIALPSGFSFERMDISGSTGDVGCSASASGAIKIKTSTGDITLEGSSADMLDLSVSTGNVTVNDVACIGDVQVSVSTGKAALTDVRCQNLTSGGDTGDLILKNVIAEEKFFLMRDTGDIKVEACDAAELLLKTDTGNVTGSLLSDKIFFATTDTGRVNVPKTTTGGKCEITTDTGNIRITIEP